MSGHSHWASIKHKKANVDAKRGKVFSKIAKAISIAARDGKSGNPDDNPRLRMVLEKARLSNMPRDNVERAIKKGVGEGGADAIQRVSYEGYGPGGIAIIIECLSDNPNRTLPEIRRIFETRGGKIGRSGSVAYMFKQKGLISLKKEAVEEERLIELALDAGADDVRDAGSVWEITCAPEAFAAVRESLAKAALPMEIAELTRIADVEAAPDAATAVRNLHLMSELEDHEDVENVYANFTPSEEAVAAFDKGQ